MFQALRSIDQRTDTSSRVRCCLVGGLCLAGLQLAGCATAEKKQYVEHLTHVIQPSDKPDEHVVAAFELDAREDITSVVVAVEQDEPSANRVR